MGVPQNIICPYVYFPTINWNPIEVVFNYTGREFAKAPYKGAFTFPIAIQTF